MSNDLLLAVKENLKSIEKKQIQKQKQQGAIKSVLLMLGLTTFLYACSSLVSKNQVDTREFEEVRVQEILNDSVEEVPLVVDREVEVWMQGKNVVLSNKYRKIALNPLWTANLEINDPRKEALVEYLSKTYRKDSSYISEIVDMAYRASWVHNIDVTLILGIIATESSFRHDVSSPSSHGLMQVNRFWHLEKITYHGGHHTLFEPKHNIVMGSFILKEYLNQDRGNVRKALRRYNGLGKDNDYVDKVIYYKAKFDRICDSCKINLADISSEAYAN